MIRPPTECAPNCTVIARVYVGRVVELYGHSINAAAWAQSICNKDVNRKAVTYNQNALLPSHLRPQLSNLWSMPNSVSEGFDTAMKRAHQDNSNDTPQSLG